MSHRGRILKLGAAALLAGTLAGSMMLLTKGTLRAQTGVATAPADSLPTSEVPFYSEWAGSPHARRAAEAFNHWNKEGAVPLECAKCHSTPGFREYLGADGSAGGVVHPAPIGTVITCVACHNAKTRALTSVTFPSGLRVENLGGNAIV